MKKIAIQTWDAAEHLHTEEDMVAYLEAAFELRDSALIAAALGDIARAKGMSKSLEIPDSDVKAYTKRYPYRVTQS